MPRDQETTHDQKDKEMTTMTKLKKILTATDLSSSSSMAIDRGFLLAKANQAQYTIVHAMGLSLLSELGGVFGQDLEKISINISAQTHHQLSDIVKASSHSSKIPYEIELEDGRPSTAIPAYAKSSNSDLVLIGAHGSGFIERTLLGSTAARLLRKSPCPVLVVKQEAARDYQRVLIAVDFSPSSETSVSLAQTIAPGANIILLNAYEVPFAGKMQLAGVDEEVIRQYQEEARARATHQLHDLAKRAGLLSAAYTALVLPDNAVKNILQTEEKYQCDLIVMGKHGTHVTEDLLLGSATKRVLAHSRSDVLVVVHEAK